MNNKELRNKYLEYKASLELGHTLHVHQGAQLLRDVMAKAVIDQGLKDDPASELVDLHVQIARLFLDNLKESDKGRLTDRVRAFTSVWKGAKTQTEAAKAVVDNYPRYARLYADC